MTDERLKEAGLTDAQIAAFRKLESEGCCSAQVRMLRDVRNELLDNIHGYEKIVCNLDLVLHELQKKEEAWKR